jgi:3',5'-cyclic AMP phosphodiesterase CpdA
MVEHPEFPSAPPVTRPVVVGHFSDPHLTTPNPGRLTALGLKRLLSYLSWRRKRRLRHRSGVLAAVVADFRANPPDHLLVTGDLTHLGLPGECREALAWLETLGDPATISVIPGNHDTLVADDWNATVGLWQDYFAGCAVAPGGTEWGTPPGSGRAPGDGHFPYLRRLGPVALIGLNTAVPTAPLFADGRLGAGQLERLALQLESLRREGRFRLVFLHHSPLPEGHAWRKRLRDARALLSLLREAGAEMVVHGHGHEEVLDTVDTAAGPMLVVGAPSASLAGELAAGWNRYRIEPVSSGWSVRVEPRWVGRAGVVVRGATEHLLARRAGGRFQS